MGLGSAKLLCPKCSALCQTQGVSLMAVVLIGIATLLTFGLGLIVGLFYLWHVGKRQTVCPNCGCVF